MVKEMETGKEKELLQEIAVLMEHYEGEFWIYNSINRKTQQTMHKIVRSKAEKKMKNYRDTEERLRMKGFLVWENGYYKVTVAGKKFIEELF